LTTPTTRAAPESSSRATAAALLGQELGDALEKGFIHNGGAFVGLFAALLEAS
jgi:hypothetical protein